MFPVRATGYPFPPAPEEKAKYLASHLLRPTEVEIFVVDFVTKRRRLRNDNGTPL